MDTNNDWKFFWCLFLNTFSDYGAMWWRLERDHWYILQPQLSKQLPT